jgi:hypothetical protein
LVRYLLQDCIHNLRVRAIWNEEQMALGIVVYGPKQFRLDGAILSRSFRKLFEAIAEWIWGDHRNNKRLLRSWTIVRP